MGEKGAKKGNDAMRRKQSHADPHVPVWEDVQQAVLGDKWQKDAESWGCSEHTLDKNVDIC